MGFIFLSYSRTEAQYVSWLVPHLERAHFNVWVDTETLQYGRQWQSAIRDRIESCAAVIVVMTPAAEQSTAVRMELDWAQMWKKPIVPILLSGEAFRSLRSVHYFDARDRRLPDAGFLGDLTKLATIRPPTSFEGTRHVGRVKVVREQDIHPSQIRSREETNLHFARQHLAQREQRFDPGHPDVQVARYKLGAALIDMGQFVEAISVLTSAINALERLPGNFQADIDQAQNLRLIAYRRAQGQPY